MGADKRITVHSRLTVVPHKPTPAGRVHPLSFLDHMLQLHTVRSVYYFDTASGKEREKLVDALKESLCRALSANPVFAGRLRKTGDGWWEVKCNDAGVRVFEATASISLDDCLQSRDCSLELELSRMETNPDHTISPLAVFQFTDFTCGGLAIGISWLHAIGDPLCGNLFMKVWGETHRLAQVLHPPFFHTPSLRPRPKVNSTDVRSRDYYTSAFCNRVENDVSDGYQTVMLCFSHDMVEQCIAMVQNGAHKFGPASPSEVLSALIWVSILKAQARSEKEEAKVSLCLEFRKIHVPPLPNGYMGNAVHFADVSSSVGELINQDLSYAASLMNDNGAMVDTEEVRSVIDMLQELEDQGKGLCTKPIYFYSAGLTICVFDHFFCYDVQFHFGKPLRAGYIVEPVKGEGQVIVLPAAEGKFSRNVIVTLPPEVMERFCKDADLLRFAQSSSSDSV